MHNAFIPKKHDPVFNPNKPDVYYFDVKLVDKVKKIGPGDEDYIIEKKEVISKQLIQEVIDAQADDVGLEAALKKFAITGDPSVLPSALPEGGETFDMSGMPEDLIDVNNYLNDMKAKFDALPEALKQGRDFNAFMSTINQQQFDAYIASLQPKVVDKKGEE